MTNPPSAITPCRLCGGKMTIWFEHRPMDDGLSHCRISHADEMATCQSATYDRPLSCDIAGMKAARTATVERWNERNGSN